MTEAEVSLRIALYYIKNNLTVKNVKVSLDGAHIKTGNTVHFPIDEFLSSQNCKKESQSDRWQGIYEVHGYKPRLEISSTPGMGDVVVYLENEKIVYVESKKGKPNKSSQEYSLMREAIGQLMTGVQLSKKYIPMVAVPYSEKSFELANRWTKLEQIQNIGIKFALVRECGDIVFV